MLKSCLDLPIMVSEDLRLPASSYIDKDVVAQPIRTQGVFV